MWQYERILRYIELAGTGEIPWRYTGINAIFARWLLATYGAHAAVAIEVYAWRVPQYSNEWWIDTVVGDIDCDGDTYDFVMQDRYRKPRGTV